jgi:DNA mismatch endonuclease (patch repair protein)
MSPKEIEQQSRSGRTMSKVRSRNTRPELRVRQLAHRSGLRFRLHRRDLPGTPDLVFPRHRTVVFVHGCFWHRHPGCRRASTPASNVEFWQTKFARNQQRDEAASIALTGLGWRVLVIWECETRPPPRLLAILTNAFGVPAGARTETGVYEGQTTVVKT